MRRAYINHCSLCTAFQYFLQRTILRSNVSTGIGIVYSVYIESLQKKLYKEIDLYSSSPLLRLQKKKRIIFVT